MARTGWPKRTRRIDLLMNEKEREALETVSQHYQMSMGNTVRELVREELQRIQTQQRNGVQTALEV